MPRFEDGSYGSAKGIALIAKVLAGKCSMPVEPWVTGQSRRI